MNCTQEENVVQGIWNLRAHPIISNDSLALIFERKHINDNSSSIYDYRILYYDIHKKICSEKTVDFTLDNEYVVTVLGKEDAFRYVGYSKTLIVGFQCGDGYCRFYKMKLQDKKYVDPIECNIHMSMDMHDGYEQNFCTEFSCLKSYIAFDFNGMIAVSEI